MEGVAFRVGGLCLVALVSLLILRQVKPEWGTFVRLAVSAAAAGMIVTMATTVLSFAEELSGMGGGALTADTWGILVKSLGVAFLSEVAASVCRDSGEGTLAGWVETAGRVEILLLSLPLIRMVLDTVETLLGGR